MKFRDDASLHGTFSGPASEAWAQAWGAEFQWRRWWSAEFAFAIAVGVQHWSVETGPLVLDPSHILHPNVDGAALIVPVGVSLVWKPAKLSTDWNWALELGVRYAWISSDVTIAFEYIDHWGNPARDAHDVPFDGRLLGVGRLELSRKFDRNRDWSWVIAAGYQWDFAEGDKNWLDMDVANDFGGWTVGLGVRKEFEIRTQGE